MAYSSTSYLKTLFIYLVVVVGAVEKWSLTTKLLIKKPINPETAVENPVKNLWKKSPCCGTFFHLESFQQVPQGFHRALLWKK
jgi:hypothetical protein